MPLCARSVLGAAVPQLLPGLLCQPHQLPGHQAHLGTHAAGESAGVAAAAALPEPSAPALCPSDGGISPPVQLSLPLFPSPRRRCWATPRASWRWSCRSSTSATPSTSTPSWATASPSPASCSTRRWAAADARGGAGRGCMGQRAWAGQGSGLSLFSLGTSGSRRGPRQPLRLSSLSLSLSLCGEPLAALTCTAPPQAKNRSLAQKHLLLASEGKQRQSGELGKQPLLPVSA